MKYLSQCSLMTQGRGCLLTSQFPVLRAWHVPTCMEQFWPDATKSVALSTHTKPWLLLTAVDLDVMVAFFNLQLGLLQCDLPAALVYKGIEFE